MEGQSGKGVNTIKNGRGKEEMEGQSGKGVNTIKNGRGKDKKWKGNLGKGLIDPL